LSARWIYRLVAALALGASTASVTLAQLNIPNRDFWISKSGWLYVATTVLAFAAINQLPRYVNSPKAIRAYEQDVRAILSGGLKEVCSATGADYNQVGIHLFRIGGIVFKRLVNVGSLRLQSGPNMLDPCWTKGMGVVGKSWKTNAYLAVDWEEYFNRWESQGARRFRQQNRDDRFRLNWGMFQLMRGYKRIAANPIRNNKGDVIGCVAVDVAKAKSKVENQACRQALHNMAISVAALGRPPAGWTQGRLR
jgi:hypothetical protein